MRFKVTVFAADGDNAVEGEVVNRDEMEEMGTVHVPGQTQADAEAHAFGCIGGGPGWHPVFETTRIPSFLFMEHFELDDGRVSRFVYNLEIECVICMHHLESGKWIPSSADDYESLRCNKKLRGIVWSPERYPAATQVMERAELPAWTNPPLST